MSGVDVDARACLKEALIKYMALEMSSYTFDEVATDVSNTSDDSVRQISSFLYFLYDDTVDHAISVSADNWATLRRIIAFLATGLEIRTTEKQDSWPFAGADEWRAQEHFVGEVGLPDYDPEVHGRQVHSWWGRIPTGVGLTLLSVIVVAAIAVAFLSC